MSIEIYLVVSVITKQKTIAMQLNKCNNKICTIAGSKFQSPNAWLYHLPIFIPASSVFNPNQTIPYSPLPHSVLFLLHQLQTTEKMKTKIIIIAAVLFLQAGFLFAGNESTSAPVASPIATIRLAPTTPVEATFEEVAFVNECSALVPVTPWEATFEDMPTEMISMVDLAPSLPNVADFDDYVVTITIDNALLATVTPAFANFE